MKISTKKDLKRKKFLKNGLKRAKYISGLKNFFEYNWNKPMNR